MADLETSHATLDHTGLTGVGGSVASLDDVGDVNAPTPSNGDVLTWDSTPGEWVASAPSGGSGGGVGSYFLVPHAVPFTQDVGTWIIQQATAEDPYPFGGWQLACTSGAQNDAVSFPAIWFEAGTYAIDYVIRRSTNTGIFTVKIAGSSVGTIDTYVSPGGHIASGAITGISIASSGSKTIQLVLATKNASSSGYFGSIFTLNFRRTA